MPLLLHQSIFSEDKNQPTGLAILAPGQQAMSYQELSKFLNVTALQLTRLGIRPGDRLAIVLPNGPVLATAFLAISKVCTCAPLNPAYTFEEYQVSLADLRVKSLVISFGKEHPACKAAVSLGIPIINLKADEKRAGNFSLECDTPEDAAITSAILAGEHDVALILQTSGTTSRPKVVPLTHRNIYFSMQNIKETYDLKATDRCLNMMPLFHVHGLIGSVAASLASGASVICTPGFSADLTLDWLVELEPTWYTAVPTIHQAVLERVRQHPERTRAMKLRFIRSCSSPLAPQVAQDLERAFRVPVLEAYGMTEGTHQIASNPLPPRSHKFGSVGCATGTTRVSIMDENGKVLLPGKIGEICISGDNVMNGYENNPVANATNFTNGWLRTGDRGTLDEDGYLFIQGRLKEFINRAGEKISPREIDEILLEHPAVKQAVAFSMPHPTLGEDVAAAVVLKPGEMVTMWELRRFTSNKLVDFKVPRLIVFVSDIPKGPTGKIQRIGLGGKLKKELEELKIQETSDNSDPRTPIETTILSIWEQVMGLGSIGIHDDFLALGGDSFKAARILMLVGEKYHIVIPLKEIFTAPTVELMAKLIEELQVKNL